MQPYLSVVIPIYQEEQSLPFLSARLFPVLDGMGKPYEVIFVNDGSRDRSQELLEQIHRERPDVLRVVQFQHNCGQHPAILAGFERVRADLQNPPEDIPRLLEKIAAGHDVVSGYRAERLDSAWRMKVSAWSNVVRKKTTGIQLRDHGCMLAAYRKEIVDLIVNSNESSPFLTVLAHYYAYNPAEIQVGHEERVAGESNYTLYKLIRYNFDLMTSFSLVPLQLFTLLGMALSAGSALLVVYMGLRRVFIGPEAEGVFTLFAILFFLMGVTMTGLGIVGEYVGRIYKEVRARPRYVVRRELDVSEQKRKAA
jgi:undecaprenyl-phosphate 4-deoxy-4-formamido-L-arabinose transferase